MTKTLTIIATLVAIISGVGGMLWGADTIYQRKAEAIQPQTFHQLRQVLEQELQGVKRKNLMQDYMFLQEQEKRALKAYEETPSEENRLDVQSYRKKKERVMEGLGL